jgi:hypothetical protein
MDFYDEYARIQCGFKKKGIKLRACGKGKPSKSVQWQKKD